MEFICHNIAAIRAIIIILIWCLSAALFFISLFLFRSALADVFLSCGNSTWTCTEKDGVKYWHKL